MAFDAEICPRCMGKDPNPSARSRFALIGLVLGVVIFAGLGVAYFYSLQPNGASIVGGVLLGSLAGCLIGPIAGWLVGKVIGNKPVTSADDTRDFGD